MPEPLREPLPTKPGYPEQADTEYRRNGTCGVFMGTEPLALWGHTEALAQRSKKDWARNIQWLLDTRYPVAEKAVLVMGKLNTHTPSWLYETVTPEEAFRLAERLGIRFMPKHRSRLEIAEVEMSALAARCLGLRRIGSIQALNVEVPAWHTQGKEKRKGVDWQYTAGDVRITLKGFEAALERKKRLTPPRIKIDGEAEAKIIALACSEPPPGRGRWTLKLLAGTVVELGILDSISDHGIGTLLQKRHTTLPA